MRYTCLILAMLIAPTCAPRPAVAREPEPPKTGDFVTVEATVVELRTDVTGSLQPKNRVIVPTPITGKVEWVIEEGTRVKAGTEVARVDCTEYLESLEQQKLQLSVVEAELEREKLGEQLAKVQLQAAVDKAGLELERARLARGVLGEPTETEKELSRLTVEQTRFAMDAAEREWQRLRKLGESGIQSGRTIDLARLRYERARADYLKAKADDDLLLQGDPVEDLKVADEEVKRAEVNLKLAREHLTSEAAYQVTQVQVAQIAVDRVKALIDLQQGRIDRSRVAAPVDGVVIYPRRWGMPIREGDLVWESNRFLDVADLSTMTVESALSQIDWPRVKVGQKVELHLVAHPETLYHGIVTHVGVLARDRSLILKEDVANVMSFSVQVDIDEQSPFLKPSYTVRMSIITDRFDSAVAVPRAAVMHEGGETWVWVKTGDATARRDVDAGPSDATHVVINRGLELGEQVLVPLSREGSRERRTASP